VAISAASLPLPAGAATDATLSSGVGLRSDDNAEHGIYTLSATPGNVTTIPVWAGKTAVNHPAQDQACTYWTDGDASTPVFQRPAEFDALLALYRQRQPKRVLEIGTYYGGTLKQWIHAATPERVVSVDLFLPHYDPRAKAAGWAATAGVDLIAIQGDSRDPAIIAQVAALGPFDWIVIDADHTYDAVAADWENHATQFRCGAAVVLHDIVACPQRHPEIDVPRFWNEFVKPNHRTLEFVEDYAAPWGGLGVVLL
jgi:cephalosporin hydroxylase